MYDDFIEDDFALPEFDAINELQLFDSRFEIGGPITDLDDMSVSFN